MTKDDIIRAIWNEFPNFTANEARKTYETTINVIKDHLSKGGHIELRGFGIFKVREKKERAGRNPKNGVGATIKARRVVSFVPSKIFKDQVNKGNDSQ